MGFPAAADPEPAGQQRAEPPLARRPGRPGDRPRDQARHFPARPGLLLVAVVTGGQHEQPRLTARPGRRDRDLDRPARVEPDEVPPGLRVGREQPQAAGQVSDGRRGGQAPGRSAAGWAAASGPARAISGAREVSSCIGGPSGAGRSGPVATSQGRPRVVSDNNTKDGNSGRRPGRRRGGRGATALRALACQVAHRRHGALSSRQRCLLRAPRAARAPGTAGRCPCVLACLRPGRQRRPGNPRQGPGGSPPWQGRARSRARIWLAAGQNAAGGSLAAAGPAVLLPGALSRVQQAHGLAGRLRGEPGCRPGGGGQRAECVDAISRPASSSRCPSAVQRAVQPRQRYPPPRAVTPGCGSSRPARSAAR